MIISKKQKKIIYLVPKTGTISLVKYFKNINTDLLYIMHSHGYISDNDYFLTESLRPVVKDIGHEELKTYKYYCFYRDPVDRAISAFNHIKRNPFFKTGQPKKSYISLKNFLNTLFEIETGIKLNDAEKNICLFDRSSEQREFFDKLSIRKFIEYYDLAKKNPDQFGLEIDFLVPNLSVFDKQEIWFNTPNMTVLNFHDFENELKWLFREFGGDPDSFKEIPKVNTSPSNYNLDYYKSLLQKTVDEYDPEDIDFIKNYYKNDYELYQKLKRNINTA